MIEEIKNIKSDKRELRRFGLTLGVILLFWGGLFLWRRKGGYFYFFILSSLFAVVSVFAPIVLKPLHIILRTIFVIISSILTWLILVILFYLVVTPIGVIARLFGKKFLDFELNDEAASYWILKENINLNKESYENQF